MAPRKDIQDRLLKSVFCVFKYKAYSKLIAVTVRHPKTKLVSKVSFKAMGVCKDIQYNKKYVLF